MDIQDQKRFVSELMNTIESEIQTAINAGKIPAAWNGVELSQLVADRSQPLHKMDRKRKAAYDNVIRTSNL